jgi:Putative transposase
LTNGEVTFRYRVHGEGSSSARRGLLTLSIAEFIRRYLLHVPPPGTRIVRYYGLYVPTKSAALAVCRAQLGQAPVAKPACDDGQTDAQQDGTAPYERCPVCGRRLLPSGIILPPSRPPPAVMPGEAVA